MKELIRQVWHDDCFSDFCYLVYCNRYFAIQMHCDLRIIFLVLIIWASFCATSTQTRIPQGVSITPVYISIEVLYLIFKKKTTQQLVFPGITSSNSSWADIQYAIDNDTNTAAVCNSTYSNQSLCNSFLTFSNFYFDIPNNQTINAVSFNCLIWSDDIKTVSLFIPGSGSIPVVISCGERINCDAGCGIPCRCLSSRATWGLNATWQVHFRVNFV